MSDPGPETQATHTEYATSRPTQARLPLSLVLMGLSAGGMIAACILWYRGHGWLGARLLAGDVLLIFVLLLRL